MAEDNEHIWLYPETQEAHDEIWKDGLGRNDFWGAIATKCYNRERKRGKEGVAQPKEVEWIAESVRACRRALRRIIQWPSTEDSHEGYTGDEKWMVCHILRGLVPKALATEWARVFKEMPKSVVEHVSRLFCRFIEKKGRETAMRENSRIGEAVWCHREMEAQTPGGSAEMSVATNIWTETPRERVRVWATLAGARGPAMPWHPERYTGSRPRGD